MKCPFCSAQMECHTAMTPAEDEVPEDGDFALCIGCGEFCTFVVDANDHAIGTRKPNDAEYELFVTHPHFAMIRQAWVDGVAEAKKQRQAAREAAQAETAYGLFTTEWKDYERDVLPKLGPKAMRMLKDTFYAGALTLLATLRDVAQQNPEIVDKMRGFNALRDEVESYLHGRVRK